MTTVRRALWVILALLGIALAASLTWAVTRLAGEHIGLAAAPISVVHGLAPSPAPGRTATTEREPVTVTRTVTVTVAAPSTGRQPTPTSGAATPAPAQGAATPAPGQGSGPPAVTITTPARSRGDDSSSGGSSRAPQGRDD